jgi:hypothetical protein
MSPQSFLRHEHRITAVIDANRHPDPFGAEVEAGVTS